MIKIVFVVISILGQSDLCRAHYFRIKSSSNDAPLCLNAELGMFNNKIDGTKLTLQPCTGEPNQQFSWDADSHSYNEYQGGRLIKSSNGMCLNVNRAEWEADKNGAEVTLWSCVDGYKFHERWKYYAGVWKSYRNWKCLAAESNTVGANVYIIDCNGDDNQFWGTNGFKTEIQAGQALEEGDAIYSPNGEYMAYQKYTGKFLLLNVRTTKIVWQPTRKYVNKKGPCRLSLQFDNNLVTYCDGKVIWATGTNKKNAVGTTRLVLQDDRNLVIYDSVGNALWGSGSNHKLTAEDEGEDEGNTKFPYVWLVLAAGLALFIVVIVVILVMNRRKLRKMVLVLENEENEEENEENNEEENDKNEEKEEDQQMVQTADVEVTSQ